MYMLTLSHVSLQSRFSFTNSLYSHLLGRKQAYQRKPQHKGTTNGCKPWPSQCKKFSGSPFSNG